MANEPISRDTKSSLVRNPSKPSARITAGRSVIVWKLVRGDGNPASERPTVLEVESARGMIARFDAIEQLAAGSMAARRGTRTARSTSDCAQGEEAI
jgi:hypothetical protein